MPRDGSKRVSKFVAGPLTAIVQRLETALDDGALVDYISAVGAGYDAVARGDFGAALPSLRTSPARESPLMAAERHYVAAICLMELQQRARVSEAVQILRSWAVELDGEIELQFRYELLLQQAHVLAQDFDNARQVELGIERRLLARQRFDPDAPALLAIQNRRSGAINAPEIAELRIEDSVSFFRARAADSPCAALELYRALNNLAAIRVRLGKEEKAWHAARDAEAVALETPDVVKRADVLASNLVLASLRAGAASVEEAIERQRFIVDSPEGAADKFIHRCNLAAYLLLARRDEAAESELARLAEERHAGEFDESYLTFYWSALWAASAAVRGDRQTALRRHAESDEFVRNLRWPTAGVVRRRHELGRLALAELSLGDDRAALDRLLIDRHPGEISASWPYYARLFPCCELSFWSDS